MWQVDQQLLISGYCNCNTLQAAAESQLPSHHTCVTVVYTSAAAAQQRLTATPLLYLCLHTHSVLHDPQTGWHAAAEHPSAELQLFCTCQQHACLREVHTAADNADQPLTHPTCFLQLHLNKYMRAALVKHACRMPPPAFQKVVDAPVICCITPGLQQNTAAFTKSICHACCLGAPHHMHMLCLVGYIQHHAVLTARWCCVRLAAALTLLLTDATTDVILGRPSLWLRGCASLCCVSNL